MIKKRIKRFISLLVFTLICLIPLKVDAASLSINPSATKVKPNTNVTINIAANGFTNGFGSMTFTVKFDASKFSFVSSKSLQGTSLVSNSNGQILVTIESADGQTSINNGNIYQIVLKSNDSSGTSNVVVSSSDCFMIDGATAINVSGSTKTLTHYVPSTNNNLKSLSVSGCTLSPKFNTNTTSYTCADTTASSVSITASATDSTASVSGTGKKNLNVGDNKLTVTVTSESGSKKYYYINIKRIDNRNGDNTLSSLTIENHPIDFNANTTIYNLNVSESVSTINVLATPTNAKSTVTGTGVHTLIEGLNKIVIRVTAENGMSKDYVINVTKAAKANVPSTKLTKLKVENKNLDINKNIFLVGAPNNASTVKIEYETTSKTTSYEVLGNENLTDGINLVTITVKDIDCEDSIYTLLVYKNSYKRINSIGELTSITENISYNIGEKETHIIYQSNSELIKNSDYQFVYNIVNEYEGLLYNLVLDNTVSLDSDLEPILQKDLTNDFTYNSNIPANIKINLYLDELLNQKMYLYSYENNKYNLIEEVDVVNGYVEFTSNGSTKYIFSKEQIVTKNEKSASVSKKEWVTRIQYLLVGIVIGILGTILFSNIKTKKKKSPTIKPIERL